MPETLAAAIRRKYPGTYDDMSDRDLESRIDAKYPGAYDDIPRASSISAEQRTDSEEGEGVLDRGRRTVSMLASGDVGGALRYMGRGAVQGMVGAAKGAATTAINLGALADRASIIEPVSEEDQAIFSRARETVSPTNAGQRAGFTAEQIGEFLALPGPGKARGAKLALEALKSGAASGGLASVQGASPGEAATTGVLGATGAAIPALGRWIGSKAEPLVRAHVKPTVAAMQRIAGASVEGIEAKATQLVRFVLDNRLTTAPKAQKIFETAERELQRVLAVKNAPTDAPARALRYLGALEKSAAKQGLPADDVAMLKSAAKEVLESGLGEHVIPPGQWLPKATTRAPRSDVTAQEALERARATSRWDTRKAWGEQKGTRLEASKAVERALRDAVKKAVPETKALLKREGLAIQAQKALDRSEFRAANRDVVSLPAHVVAAGEISRGRVPILSLAANWLRNNQARLGIYADQLGKAITQGDTGRVVSILHRLGVGSSAQLMEEP